LKIYQILHSFISKKHLTEVSDNYLVNAYFWLGENVLQFIKIL